MTPKDQKKAFHQVFHDFHKQQREWSVSEVLITRYPIPKNRRHHIIVQTQYAS